MLRKSPYTLAASAVCVVLIFGCQSTPSGSTGCETVGTAIGGLLGGILGSQIGKGSGRTAAIIGGAVLGGVIGNRLGKHLDERDQCMIGRALDKTPDGRSATWENDRGQQRTVTPTRTYVSRDGRQCRDFVQEAIVNGQTEKLSGTACKRPDGTAWDEV